jgi:hypothetical protein
VATPQAKPSGKRAGAAGAGSGRLSAKACAKPVEGVAVMPSAALPTALATSRLVGLLDIDRQGPCAIETPEADWTASFAAATKVK